MKTTRIALLALPLLSLTLVSGYSQAEGLAPSSSAAFAKQQVKNIEAAAQYPGDVAEREGRAVVEQARSSSEDKKRWSHVVMQSDAAAEEADTLVMSLVRAIKFDMQLQPNDGHIIFTVPGTRHVFKLANSAGSKGNICPSYSVRVLEASNGHVVFRKVCKPFEYLRNRVYMSNEFYLYDVQTATIRNLWTAIGDQKGAAMLEANPPIVVRHTANGYRFDWAGMHPGEDGPVKMHIRNVYTREKNGKLAGTLSCTDLNFPGKEGLESESCQGGILPLVEKTRK
jgi:hypothetical protein